VNYFDGRAAPGRRVRGAVKQSVIVGLERRWIMPTEDKVVCGIDPEHGSSRAVPEKFRCHRAGLLRGSKIDRAVVSVAEAGTHDVLADAEVAVEELIGKMVLKSSFDGWRERGCALRPIDRG